MSDRSGSIAESVPLPYFDGDSGLGVKSKREAIMQLPPQTAGSADVKTRVGDAGDTERPLYQGFTMLPGKPAQAERPVSGYVMRA